jgi:hypothetical protein
MSGVFAVLETLYNRPNRVSYPCTKAEAEEVVTSANENERRVGFCFHAVPVAHMGDMQQTNRDEEKRSAGLLSTLSVPIDG